MRKIIPLKEVLTPRTSEKNQRTGSEEEEKILKVTHKKKIPGRPARGKNLRGLF